MEQKNVIGELKFGYKGLSIKCVFKEGDENADKCRNLISQIASRYESNPQLGIEDFCKAFKREGLSEFISDEFYKVARRKSAKSLAWMLYGLAFYSIIGRADMPDFSESLARGSIYFLWAIESLKFINTNLARRSLDRMLLE